MTTMRQSLSNRREAAAIVGPCSSEASYWFASNLLTGLLPGAIPWRLRGT
jgi:hypothetical protein